MAWYSVVSPSSPLPSTYAGLPDDMDNWSCANFITYWENLKASTIARANARAIFLADVGNTGAWADVNLCKYDCSFVNYFESEGFADVGNIFSTLWCAANTVATATNTVATAVSAGAPAVSNTASAASNITSDLSKLTQPKALIAVGIVGGLLWYELKYRPSQSKSLKGYRRR